MTALQVVLNEKVLVLNRLYTAIRVINARRAFTMLCKQAAEVIAVENGQYVNYDLESWTEVADSLYYDLRIVRDDGDLVWHERVAGNRWSLPEGLSLQDGTEYFVRVDALMDNARAAISGSASA